MLLFSFSARHFSVGLKKTFTAAIPKVCVAIGGIKGMLSTIKSLHCRALRFTVSDPVMLDVTCFEIHA